MKLLAAQSRCCYKVVSTCSLERPSWKPILKQAFSPLPWTGLTFTVDTVATYSPRACA